MYLGSRYDFIGSVPTILASNVFPGTVPANVLFGGILFTNFALIFKNNAHI
jgi:hypothetical protein